MAGVFPDGGIPAGQATNSTDVDTNCSAELFYSTASCSPRFEPAAMNALISEVLNVIACAGATYDCNSLTNLCEAIRRLAGAQEAAQGEVVGPGQLIISSDDDLMWNCTGSDITVGADLTSAGLTAQGFCPVDTDTFASAEPAPNAGTDSFGTVYQATDPLITFPDGTTLAIVGGAAGAAPATATQLGSVELATGAEITDAATNGTSGPLAITPNGLSGAQNYNTGGGGQGPVDGGQDRVWLRDATDGNMYWTRVNDIPSGAGLGPFSAGQNSADWQVVFKGDNPSGAPLILPAGPAGVPGYWEVTEAVNTNGADVMIQGVVLTMFAQPGDQIAIPTGGTTTVRVAWRHSV